MKTLILYVFHQGCENLDVFIKRGLIDSPDMTFVFISNNLEPNLDRWKFIDEHSNVHLYIRQNIGHDFQGWNEVLFLPLKVLDQKIIYSKETELDNSALHTLYDRFVCINSTVSGPYLPLYVQNNWVDCFTSRLSTDVKLVGISANFMGGKFNPHIYSIIRRFYKIDPKDSVHIQSMAFCLDREGLDILIKYRLFYPGKQFPRNKMVLIYTCEIAMSSILRHEQKSLFSFMAGQGLINLKTTQEENDIWNIAMSFPLYEFMFVKANRGIVFPEKDRYLCDRSV